MSLVAPDAALPSSSWPPQFSSAFVDAARARLTDSPVLVIVGRSGSGRNVLASAIAELPPGPVWSRHVARFGEADIPYFGLRQLFPSLRLVSVDGPDAVEQAARQHLLTFAGPLPPLVLADADLCDPESIEILARLAGSGDLRLIATVPPEALPDLRRLLDGAEVIDVAPVSTEVVAELLRERFGAAPHPELVDVLTQRCDGIFARVCDIADRAVTSGAFVMAGGVLVLAPEPVTPLSTTAAGEGPELAGLVHLTALLGLIDRTDAEAHFPREVIDRLIAGGDLQVVAGALHFTSTVEVALVRRALSHRRQIDLFERFAALLPHTIARAGVAVRAGDWWRAAGAPLPAALAARAAREANLTGRYRRAVVFTDPANIEGLATVALVERIYALVEVGDYAELRSLYAGLDPATLTEEELLPYFRWLGRLRDDEDRTALGQRAVMADEPAAARRRVAVRTLSDLIDRAFVGGGEILTSQLRALAFTSLLSPPNRAIAFTTLAGVLRASGRPAQAVEAAEFALTLLEAEGDDVSAFHLDTAREYHVLALLSALELDRAELAVHAYEWGPFSRPGSGRLTTAMHAIVDLHRGDTDMALTNLRLCLAGIRLHDPRNVRGWLRAVLATILAGGGRPDEAEVMLEASGTSRTGRPQWDLERLVAQAFVLDRLAEPEVALDLLEEVITEADRRDLLLVQIEAAALSVMIGGPPQLPALVALVDDLVEPNGVVAVWQTFARAARDRDLGTLVALAERLDERGSTLYAAPIAQYVLDVSRGSDELDPAARARMEELCGPQTGPDVS